MGIFDKNKIEKLLKAIYYDDIEKVKKILDEAIENKKILKLLNEKGKYTNEYNYKCESYPLLLATHENNLAIVKLLIDYATENKIILEINEKSKYGWYPLFEATRTDNIEMVKLLIDYANRNKIILKLNEKGWNGCTPIIEAILLNNIEMLKLLIKYSIEKGIKLKIDENEIEDAISKKYSRVHLIDISDINNEFIRLLNIYRNDNSIIEFIFTGIDSKLLKMLNEQRKKERIEKEQIKRERLEKERIERERVEKERLERERLEKERIERERAEKERLERERLERERIERERTEKERLERERLERERIERERTEKERLERERIERERTEKERLERERLERERIERERTEKERLEREKIERERKNENEDKLRKENELLKLKLEKINIDNFKNKLKNLIKNNECDILQEDFYEWKINNWNQLSNEIFSSIFDAINHKWRIILNPNIIDEEDYTENISVGIEVMDINKEYRKQNIHIESNFIIAIHNFDEYSCHYEEIYDEDQPIHFSINKLKRGMLFEKNNPSIKSIIENNQIVISTYILSYKYEEDEYMKELNSLCINEEDDEENENENEIENYTEWDLNVSKLKVKKKIKFDKYKWLISLYPNEMNKQYISFKIENLNILDDDEDSSIPILAKCVVSIRNINNYSCFWAKGTSLISFNEDCEGHEIKEFIEKENLLNKENNNLAIDDKVKLGILLKIK